MISYDFPTISEGGGAQASSGDLRAVYGNDHSGLSGMFSSS